MRYRYILLLLFWGFTLQAQDQWDSPEESEPVRHEGILFSLGLGYTFPGAGPAEYYNGAGVYNNLYNRIYEQPQIYNQIKDSYNNYDWEIAQYPQDMFYRSSMFWTLNAYYYFKNGWGFYGTFSSARLEANGIFTNRVLRFNGGQTEPILETEPIRGTEQRLRFGAGVAKIFYNDSPINFFMEAGFEFNWQNALDNEVQVGGRTYSIFFNQQNIGGNVIFQNSYGGGAALKTGLNTALGNKSIVDLGVGLYAANYNLSHSGMEVPGLVLDAEVFLRFSLGLF
jgi:hypothetical protein